MRFSKAYIPTTKETPSDAILPSHIFLSRAGFISQVASGLYNYLPLGLKVLENIKQVVKEELDHAGAQEVLLSFVTPTELWEESGRLEKFGKELLRFHDRKDNMFVLGPTHEEMMVNIVRNKVTSYKHLPLNLYQINTKFRDEARPRFGLMRGREFLMKDGYSFHSSEEDMIREFNLMETTYKKILTRLGLEFRVVEADSGAIGGSGSKEIMVIADSGEDTIAICTSCEYGANVEAAKRQKLTTSYGATKYVVCDANFDTETKRIGFCIREDDTLQEVKAANAVKANDIDILEDVPFLEDMFCVYDIEVESAYTPSDNTALSDIAQIREGDLCSCCSSPITFSKGIECGHIFQLGTTYSKPLGATFLDEDGKQQAMQMATFGLGVSRLAAAVVEQHHDEKGCKWTMQTAPYKVNVMVSNIKDDAQVTYGEDLYEQLKVNHISTIIDDRKERFGFKIKDAELIGFPFTVIVGKTLVEGTVDVLDRMNDTKITMKKEEVLPFLQDKIKG